MQKVLLLMEWLCKNIMPFSTSLIIRFNLAPSPTETLTPQATAGNGYGLKVTWIVRAMFVRSMWNIVYLGIIARLEI
jgi:hypothetical protein